jgi:Tfp pilus assembly protein PilP
MKLEQDQHRRGRPDGRTYGPTGPALAVLAALLALWAWIPAGALAQAQAPVELNVQVGSAGSPGGGPVAPPPPPAVGEGPGEGFTTDPGVGAQPLSAPAPLPDVPADAPPPIPPSLAPLTPPEPEVEPQTPEEIQALETRNETYAKLNDWHKNIMGGYAFNTGLMNDPFMPIDSVARPADTGMLAAQDEERRRRLPLLQRLALNQFTLSAIVVSSDPNATSALLDSGGRSFIVHRGTLIGPNGGYVKEIAPNRVIVVEPQVNYRGETQLAETVYRLNALEDDSLDDFQFEQGGYGG